MKRLTALLLALACSAAAAQNTATWSSTYALGLALTNTSASPIDIKLPIGGYFILCPTAGAFTFTAIDQSAG